MFHTCQEIPILKLWMQYILLQREDMLGFIRTNLNLAQQRTIQQENKKRKPKGDCVFILNYNRASWH